MPAQHRVLVPEHQQFGVLGRFTPSPSPEHSRAGSERVRRSSSDDGSRQGTPDRVFEPHTGACGPGPVQASGDRGVTLRRLYGGLLLGRAMDAAAALGQVVDGQLDDLPAGVEFAHQGACGGIGSPVAELRDEHGAVAQVPVDVDIDEECGIFVRRDRPRFTRDLAPQEAGRVGGALQDPERLTLGDRPGVPGARVRPADRPQPSPLGRTWPDYRYGRR